VHQWVASGDNTSPSHWEGMASENRRDLQIMYAWHGVLQV